MAQFFELFIVKENVPLFVLTIPVPVAGIFLLTYQEQPNSWGDLQHQKVETLGFASIYLRCISPAFSELLITDPPVDNFVNYLVA